MTDPIFADRRLAVLYDTLEGDRDDLRRYLDIVEEFAARHVLDVGCGTGSFACLLAERGLQVVGVDPAAASLEIARAKPHAEQVRWVHGEVAALPPLQVDLATMTANVAQVFLTDEEWAATLRGVRQALRPGGRLVFESRRPEREAWREWTRQRSLTRIEVPGAGAVECWVTVTERHDSVVSFRWTYRFATGGRVLTSDSTLRFRTRDEFEESLTAAGFELDEVRDAPDRPGREWVFIASRPG